MSKVDPASVSRLKSFIERIERLREEKKAIGSDERDVFSEAKGVGYDTKAMREVLKRRAMDASDRDEWDNLVDTYEHALGLRGEAASAVAAGATYEEAADKTGLSRASVARAVASRKNLENDTPQTADDTPPDESCGPVRPVGEPTVAGGPPSHRMDAPVLDTGTSASMGETAGVSAPGPQEPDDLMPPAALLEKRREILDRRQKVSV